MIAAVNLAGDADTIGAVFGQLAGAMYGMSAIPRRWIEAVKDWRKVDALIESFIARFGEKGMALGDEGKKDCEVPKVSNENKVVVFHKRVKEFGETKVFPKVAVPVADIRTIAESHIDGTTLVRTSDGGTIAVAESFEEAIKIWRAK